MQTVARPTTVRSYRRIQTSFPAAQPATGFWARFAAYCRGQEHNRLLWLGVILAAHGCIITPAVIMFTMVAGPSHVLFMTAMVSMALALVTNLAAMPTRVTIPAFALSLLIDLGVVIAAAAMLVG